MMFVLLYNLQSIHIKCSSFNLKKICQIGIIIFKIFRVKQLKLKLIRSYLKCFSYKEEKLKFDPNFSNSIH